LAWWRGISVLIGVAFERPFCPEGREFEQANLQSSNARGIARGGMLNFRIDRRINAADGSRITNKRRPRINAAPNQKNAAFIRGL